MTFQRTLNRSRYQSTTRAKGQKTPKLVSGDQVELKSSSDAFLHSISTTLVLDNYVWLQQIICLNNFIKKNCSDQAIRVHSAGFKLLLLSHVRHRFGDASICHSSVHFPWPFSIYPLMLCNFFK